MDQLIGILMLRYFKGYRTLIVNIAAMIVAASTLAFFPTLLSGPYGAVVLLVVGIANSIIRFDTNTPVLSSTDTPVL
jgi:hypothetical protein